MNIINKNMDWWVRINKLHNGYLIQRPSHDDHDFIEHYIIETSKDEYKSFERLVWELKEYYCPNIYIKIKKVKKND